MAHHVEDANFVRTYQDCEIQSMVMYSVVWLGRMYVILMFLLKSGHI
jgi:hypothetical protein